MNLLAHLWLAERTGTSAAGQILGDLIKGRLDNPVFDTATDQGMRLHRRIDSCCDAHHSHRALRGQFSPPFRRYAGIIVDIGFDHALARAWARFHSQALPDFAQRMEQQVCDEWPVGAPLSSGRLRGLGATLSGYRQIEGIERALYSVSRRLRRDNPLQEALPVLLDQNPEFDHHLAPLMSALERTLQEMLGQAAG